MNTIRVFVSRRLPAKAMEMLQQASSAGSLSLSVTKWESDEPPPRKDLLESVSGTDGLLCLLTDKIDAELLNAAGKFIRTDMIVAVGP